ncbi:MAG: hypothetical protein WA192_17105 [Candidatus Acidiferrales bacterium]
MAFDFVAAGPAQPDRAIPAVARLVLSRAGLPRTPYDPEYTPAYLGLDS